MMKITTTKIYKILAILLCFLLCFEQSLPAGRQAAFAQVAGQLDISGYLTQLRQSWSTDKFRPLHLRYLSYDNLNNTFKLLLDKGDFQQAAPSEPGVIARRPKADEAISNETKTLLNYFFIGVSLPNDTFWVNLRPDSPEDTIDPLLATTDVGKILLEADVQLKKDTAKWTSPDSPEGREYWDKLYQKAGEIFGSENITIPTLTRPWIVPDEIIIRESDTNAYIYKATLKVMLEQDYLERPSPGVIASPEGAKQSQYNIYDFKDDRLKELNVYSSQLIRELIIPKLTKEINSSKRYAPLRQVYYSLIMAQWFKLKFSGKPGQYSSLINRRNLDGLTSKTSWDKDVYFQAYKESFEQGEYNIKEPVHTLFGQTIRSYFSGGITVTQTAAAIAQAASTPGQTIIGEAGTLVTVTHTDRPAPAAGYTHAAERDAQGRVHVTENQIPIVSASGAASLIPLDITEYQKASSAERGEMANRLGVAFYGTAGSHQKYIILRIREFLDFMIALEELIPGIEGLPNALDCKLDESQYSEEGYYKFRYVDGIVHELRAALIKINAILAEKVPDGTDTKYDGSAGLTARFYAAANDSPIVKLNLPRIINKWRMASGMKALAVPAGGRLVSMAVRYSLYGPGNAFGDKEAIRRLEEMAKYPGYREVSCYLYGDYDGESGVTLEVRARVRRSFAHDQGSWTNPYTGLLTVSDKVYARSYDPEEYVRQVKGHVRAELHDNSDEHFARFDIHSDLIRVLVVNETLAEKLRAKLAELGLRNVPVVLFNNDNRMIPAAGSAVVAERSYTTPEIKQMMQDGTLDLRSMTGDPALITDDTILVLAPGSEYIIRNGARSEVYKEGDHYRIRGGGMPEELIRKRQERERQAQAAEGQASGPGAAGGISRRGAMKISALAAAAAILLGGDAFVTHPRSAGKKKAYFLFHEHIGENDYSRRLFNPDLSEGEEIYKAAHFIRIHAQYKADIDKEGAWESSIKERGFTREEYDRQYSYYLNLLLPHYLKLASQIRDGNSDLIEGHKREIETIKKVIREQGISAVGIEFAPLELDFLKEDALWQRDFLNLIFGADKDGKHSNLTDDILLLLYGPVIYLLASGFDEFASGHVTVVPLESIESKAKGDELMALLGRETDTLLKQRPDIEDRLDQMYSRIINYAAEFDAGKELTLLLGGDDNGRVQAEKVIAAWQQFLNNAAERDRQLKDRLEGINGNNILIIRGAAHKSTVGKVLSDNPKIETINVIIDPAEIAKLVTSYEFVWPGRNTLGIADVEKGRLTALFMAEDGSGDITYDGKRSHFKRMIKGGKEFYLIVPGGIPEPDPRRLGRIQDGDQAQAPQGQAGSPGAADKRSIADRVVGLFRGSVSSFINAAEDRPFLWFLLYAPVAIVVGAFLGPFLIIGSLLLSDLIGNFLHNYPAVGLVYLIVAPPIIVGSVFAIILYGSDKGRVATPYLKGRWFVTASRVVSGFSGWQRTVSARNGSAQNQPKRTRKQAISFDIAERMGVLAEKEVRERNKNIKDWQRGHEVDKNGITRDAESLRLYNLYSQEWKGNPLYWLAPKSSIYERVAQAHFREYVRLEKPLAADSTGVEKSSGAGGGGSSGLGFGGGGTDQAVRGFGLTADTRYSRDMIQRLLDLAVETLSMKTPKALASCDAEVNAEHKISALEDVLHLTDKQKEELRPLVRRYFALERLVHRIKYAYVTAGRVNLLSRTKWSTFSHKDLQEILRPLIYADGIQSDDIDFLSVFGEGAGLETAIDRFFGSDESVSMTLEASNALDSKAGTGFEHTGIAIVYSPEIEQDTQMMAVNAPDEDFLAQRGILLDESDEELVRQLKTEVLTLEGIRKLREEMILRQGQRESTLRSVGSYLQGPFDPRKAMIGGGVKGKYIEAVVVVDQLFDLVHSRAPAMRNKLVRASEYFKRQSNGEFENERLRQLEALRAQILQVIAENKKEESVTQTQASGPAAAAETTGADGIRKPHVGSTEGHVNEVILKAHGQLKGGQINGRQAAEMIIQAILSMPDPLEGIVNMPTAIDILGRAFQETQDQRFARVNAILRQYNTSSRVDEQLSDRVRQAYDNAGQGNANRGPGAAGEDIAKVIAKTGMSLEDILDKPADFYYNPRGAIGTPLSIAEHLQLFSYLWDNRHPSDRLSGALITQLIQGSNFGILGSMFSGKFSPENMRVIAREYRLSSNDRRILWQIFHNDEPLLSDSDFGDGPFKNIVYASIRQTNGIPRVLDLGCGIHANKITGLKKEMASAGKDIEAHGIDISPAETGNVDGVDIKQGDILEPLPYADGYFDVVYEAGVLEYYFDEPEDMERILLQIKKVLKPGGKFICYGPSSNNPVFEKVFGKVENVKDIFLTTKEDVAQTQSGTGAAAYEPVMIDPGTFTRSKKGTRGFSLISLAPFSVVPGAEASSLSKEMETTFVRSIERGERHTIIRDDEPFGMGLYPCTGVIVYNTRNHKTYAAHSELSMGKNILDMFKVIKKDADMLNPEEISVIVAGAMIIPLHFLSPAETKREAINALQQREEIMAFIRKQGFKNIHTIFSGQVGIGVDLYFDPGIGVAYPKLNIDDNLKELTKISDFIERLPDEDKLSPEMKRYGGFAAWGWGKDKGEQAGNAQPQSGPGAAGEARNANPILGLDNRPFAGKITNDKEKRIIMPPNEDLRRAKKALALAAGIILPVKNNMDMEALENTGELVFALDTISQLFEIMDESVKRALPAQLLTILRFCRKQETLRKAFNLFSRLGLSAKPKLEELQILLFSAGRLNSDSAFAHQVVNWATGDLASLPEEAYRAYLRVINRFPRYNEDGIAGIPKDMTFGIELELCLADENGNFSSETANLYYAMKQNKELIKNGWVIKRDGENIEITTRNGGLTNDRSGFAELKSGLSRIIQYVLDNRRGLGVRQGLHIHIGSPNGISDNARKAVWFIGKSMEYYWAKLSETGVILEFPPEALVKNTMDNKNQTPFYYDAQTQTIALNTFAPPHLELFTRGDYFARMQLGIAAALGVVHSAIDRPDDFDILRAGLPVYQGEFYNPRNSYLLRKHLNHLFGANSQSIISMLQLLLDRKALPQLSVDLDEAALKKRQEDFFKGQGLAAIYAVHANRLGWDDDFIKRVRKAREDDADALRQIVIDSKIELSLGEAAVYGLRSSANLGHAPAITALQTLAQDSAVDPGLRSAAVYGLRSSANLGHAPAITALQTLTLTLQTLAQDSAVDPGLRSAAVYGLRSSANLGHAPVRNPQVGSTGGHVNEAILRAHGQSTGGQANSQQAAGMIIQAILSMPDPLEGIVNMPTAIDILGRAFQETQDQRFARVNAILRQYNTSSRVDEQLSDRVRQAYDNAGQGNANRGPGAAGAGNVAPGVLIAALEKEALVGRSFEQALLGMHRGYKAEIENEYPAFAKLLAQPGTRLDWHHIIQAVADHKYVRWLAQQVGAAYRDIFLRFNASSIGPQDQLSFADKQKIINALLASVHSVYFDSKGRSVNMQDYLEDYYGPLGIKVSVRFEEATGALREDVIKKALWGRMKTDKALEILSILRGGGMPALKQRPKYLDIAEAIEPIWNAEVPIPIVSINYQDRTFETIIVAAKITKEGVSGPATAAVVLPLRNIQGEIILTDVVKDIETTQGVFDLLGKLIHELDHAVLMTVTGRQITHASIFAEGAAEESFAAFMAAQDGPMSRNGVDGLDYDSAIRLFDRQADPDRGAMPYTAGWLMAHAYRGVMGEQAYFGLFYNPDKYAQAQPVADTFTGDLEQVLALRRPIYQTLFSPAPTPSGAAVVTGERRLGTEELIAELQSGTLDIRWPYGPLTVQRVREGKAEIVFQGNGGRIIINGARFDFQKVDDHYEIPGGGMPERDIQARQERERQAQGQAGSPGAAEKTLVSAVGESEPLGDKIAILKRRLSASIERGSGWLRIVATPNEALQFHRGWSSKAIGYYEGQIAGITYNFAAGIWEKMVAWFNLSPDLERKGYFIVRKSSNGNYEIVDFVPLGSLSLDPTLSDVGEDLLTTHSATDNFQLIGIDNETARALGYSDFELGLQEELSFKRASQGNPDLITIPVHSHHRESAYANSPSSNDQAIAKVQNVVFCLKTQKGFIYNKTESKEVTFKGSNGDSGGTGGINFTGMPIAIQPIAGMQPSSHPPIQPFSSLSLQPRVDPELVKKWQEIRNLLRADIPPSPERLREYLQSCYVNGCMEQEIDKVLGCIADILRIEEERGCLTEASLKEILVALEQESSAVNLAAALNKISVPPGEPQIVPGS